MMNYSTKNQGFTLIELLTVISIFSLMVSIIMVSLVSVKKQSQESNGELQVQKVLVALELYYNTTGSYPPATGISGDTTISADVDGDGINESVKVCCASGTQCLLADQQINACAALLATNPSEHMLAAAPTFNAPASSPAISINGHLWQGIMYVCERGSTRCPENFAWYVRGLPISGIKYLPVKTTENTTPIGPGYSEPNTSLTDPLNSYNSALSYSSCHDEDALNYDPDGQEDNDLCFYPEEQIGGCTDQNDPYYNYLATYSNGSCAMDFYASYQTSVQ